MASDIEQAIRQICEEKGLSYEAVMETIESALSAAYRKDYGNKMQNIDAEFDPATGEILLYDVKTVVEDVSPEEMEKIEKMQAEEAAKREADEAARKAGLPVERDDRRRNSRDKDGEDKDEDFQDEITFNPKTDVMISDARVLKMDSAVGDVIRTQLPLPGEFGRMAAMTAKQVITQKLREAEREIIFNEFKEQEGEVLIGTVQRQEGRVILVDLGRSTGVLIPEDQIKSERYNSGDRIKVLVREVTLGTRGPQILLSRTSEELVRILFDIEIPEIADGIVEIKGIAREAGARSKVAVFSTDENVDPIGACIGQRGIRIQTIINELGGEKIDVIEWSDDQRMFVTNALAPAKVLDVEFNEDDRTAIAKVDTDQLSLAIGRGGQNVRLAAKLTGWKLSVRDEEDVSERTSESPDKEDERTSESPDKEDERTSESPDKEDEEVEEEVSEDTKEVTDKEEVTADAEEVIEETKEVIETEEVETKDEDVTEDEE